MKPALDLHNEPIKDLIIKMTVPVMLAGVVTTSYSFIDMIFASRLGSIEVASIAFVTPLFIMLQALASGVIRGGVSIIATLLGQQEQDEASAYATQLRLVVIVLSLLFAIPGFILLPVLLELAGVTADLYVQSLIYSRILFLSLPILLIFQLYVTLFKSQGKMSVISKISIGGIICNTLLNALFLYVFKFEIDGLAYATLITNIIQMLIILVLYKQQDHEFQIGWRIPEKYSVIEIWKRLLKVGVPLSLSQASAHFGFLVLNIFIIQYSHQAVAAFAIGNRIHSLLFFPAKEIGNGLEPLLAQNWGRKSIDRVKEIIKLGMIYTVVFGLFAAIVIQLIKYPIAHFLTKDDPVTYQLVIDYVGLVGWTALPWAILHTLQGVFNSFQKTIFTLVINIVRLWGLRIPGILIFYYYLPSFAENGVWYTMFFSNVLTLLFAIVYFMMIVPPMLNKEDKLKKSEVTAEKEFA
jgi:putative MATE family efflux protein